jgi:hypothetical protein
MLSLLSVDAVLVERPVLLLLAFVSVWSVAAVVVDPKHTIHPSFFRAIIQAILRENHPLSSHMSNVS